MAGSNIATTMKLVLILILLPAFGGFVVHRELSAQPHHRIPTELQYVFAPSLVRDNFFTFPPQDYDKKSKAPKEDALDSLHTAVEGLQAMRYRHNAKLAKTSENVRVRQLKRQLENISDAVNRCLETITNDNDDNNDKVRETMQDEMAKLKPHLMQSPLAERLLTWPRGYAGDYVTINHIMENQNKALDPSSFGWALEEVMRRHPLIQQHRNKMKKQSQLIAETIEQKTTTTAQKAEILSLAGGACPDLVEAQTSLETANCRFTLVEHDADAFSFLESKLTENVRQKCHFVEGNVLKLPMTSSSNSLQQRLEQPVDGYNLVLCGGLFDYLSDKLLVRLLSHIWHQLLAPCGTVFFTNIDHGFNREYNVEHIFNWKLLERSPRDLYSLCEKAGIPREAVCVCLEESGNTLMVTAEARGGG